MPEKKLNLDPGSTAPNRKAAFIKIAITGIISGLSSFLFLSWVNKLVALLVAGMYRKPEPRYILIFTVIIAAFIISRRLLSAGMIRLSQFVFWKSRGDILSAVLKADYEEILKRKPDVHSALIYDVSNLTQASLNSIQFITSVVISISCLVYMAFKSWILFLITLAVVVGGVLIYLFSVSRVNVLYKKTRWFESEFARYFNAILSGFREIRMDKQKGEALFQRKISVIASGSYENNLKAYTGFLNNQMIGQVLFYVLLTGILTYFSVTLNIPVTSTVNFLFILLYLLGAVEAVMVLLPGIMQAEVSRKRIAKLKQELINNTVTQQELSGKIPDELQDRTGLQYINVDAITFKYHTSTSSSFIMGPVSIDIYPGEIIFIYGGNGSGKTTFIHSLLGLLRYDTGHIHFNGAQLTQDNCHHYKLMFAAVFSDFFLFDELYGYESFDREKANEYLQLFELSDKVTVTDNGFSSVDVSTGQRKRLALIAAMLEKKPIIVLDEWAADQDPYFRRKFYQEILPYLKQEGFTVIAITHDDVYYHHADKLFRMEYGQLIDESGVAKNGMVRTINNLMN